MTGNCKKLKWFESIEVSIKQQQQPTMTGNKPSEQSFIGMNREQMINYMNLIAFNFNSTKTTDAPIRSRQQVTMNTTRLHGRRTRPGMLKQPRHRGMMH